MGRRTTMGVRHGRTLKKPSRKYAKQRFINVKNKCKDPIVGHGDYYSYHVHQEPMAWIDVYFPSERHKGRYFSVALTTLEYMGYVQDEWKAGELADAMFPEATLDMVWHKGKRTSPKEQEFYTADFVKSDDYDDKYAYEKELLKELVKKPRMMKETWSIDRDYWFPAIGLHATLNTPSLTEEVIKKFIADFRAAGEPITPGLVYEGEEIEVVPGKLDERHAESAGDQRKADFSRGSTDPDV